jgi:hypothetical protein
MLAGIPRALVVAIALLFATGGSAEAQRTRQASALTKKAPAKRSTRDARSPAKRANKLSRQTSRRGARSNDSLAVVEKGPAKFPKNRKLLLRQAAKNGSHDAPGFRFRSQRSVEKFRARMENKARQNDEKMSRVINRLMRRARLEIAAMQKQGKAIDQYTFMTLVHQRMGELLASGAFQLDLSPYVPNVFVNDAPGQRGAQSRVLFEHKTQDHPEYLRVEVWAFKPGDMTTPHEHPGRGATWVLGGSVSEMHYRPSNGNEVTLNKTVTRNKGHFGSVSEKPGGDNFIHVVGSPPNRQGVSHTLHMYGRAVTKGARDDLIDRADHHGQASRM